MIKLGLARIYTATVLIAKIPQTNLVMFYIAKVFVTFYSRHITLELGSIAPRIYRNYPKSDLNRADYSPVSPSTSKDTSQKKESSFPMTLVHLLSLFKKTFSTFFAHSKTKRPRALPFTGHQLDTAIASSLA